MFKTLFVLVLTSCTLANPVGHRADADSLISKMPAGAVVFGELAGLQDVLDRVQNSKRLAEFLQSDVYKQIAKQGDIQKAYAGKALAEAQLGMSLWDFAKTVIGGNVAVGLYPPEGRGQPDAIVILETKQKENFTALLEKLQPWINLAGDSVKQTERDGLKLLDLDGKAYVAIGDGRLIASNQQRLLDQTISMNAAADPDSLASNSGFATLTKRFGAKHHLQVLVDTKAISELIGRRLIPEKLGNPGASFFFGGIAELLANTPATGFTIDVTDNSFLASLGIAGSPDQLPELFRPFFSKSGTQGTRSFSSIKGIIGGFTFYRDMAKWYQSRDDLIAERALPGFDVFESGLGNILRGPDFGTDVLPAFGPTLTFLAAHQEFDHLDGEPGIKLPGFAVVLDMAQPDKGETYVQLFYQTITALLNVQAGEQGRQPWIMVSEVYNGVTLTHGKYLQKPDGDRLPLVFNFVPAAARVGNRYVISSSISVCKNVIDDLQKESRKATRDNRNLHFEIQGAPVAKALAENEQALVAQGVREGKSADKAKSDIDLFVKAVESIDSIRFTTRCEKDAFRIEFEGKLAP